MIEVPCIRANKNTGKSDCPFNPKLWKGCYLVPVGSVITKANRADTATLKTFINGKLQDNNPATRWHHIAVFEGMEDRSEGTQTQTLPNGRIVVTDRSHPLYEYQVLDGGKHYHQSLISFNGLEGYYQIMPYDTANVLMGTENPDATTEMMGYDLSVLWAHDYKPGTRSSVAEYKGLIGLADAAQMNENYFGIKCGFDLSKVKGVQDVTIVDVTTGSTSGVHMVKIYAGGGTINIVEKLGSAIANEANFIFRKKSTGATVTKTAALSADGTYVELTASLADTDYLNATTMEIGLASVSTLAGNGCKYFESPVMLEVTAIDP